MRDRDIELWEKPFKHDCTFVDVIYSVVNEKDLSSPVFLPQNSVFQKLFRPWPDYSQYGKASLWRSLEDRHISQSAHGKRK
ncbi:hypothetical protein SDC9_174029 [bioreactor metagenome]|uniref:Uncharacterized protein n=1 Tax=bioreactor metagenome TaxID=1076179 RepID=A0A645GRI6_9ZZZZ